jgi:ketosteroid isomerase-like protein
MAMANCLADAFRQKDLSQLLDMMTDDVVLLSASGPPTVGRDSAKKLCTDLFGRFDIRQHVDFSVQVVVGIENAASIHGAYVLTLTPLDGGAPVTMRGRLVTVLRHQNGAWKLARGVNWVGWVVLPTRA